MTTESLITPAVPDPPEIDAVLWDGFGPFFYEDTFSVSFDVGANCGQTLPRIKQFSDLVVAFEPSKEAYRYLVEHFAYEEGYRLSELAVSSYSGSVDLVAMEGKIETGQLVTAGTPGMEWSDGAAAGEVRSLPCITLDEYIELTGLFPAFIKIDVEGHEAEVLRGASELLRTQARPQMLIEIHSEQLGSEIYDMLKQSYRVDLVRHPHYPTDSLLWRSHFWFRCFPA